MLLSYTAFPVLLLTLQHLPQSHAQLVADLPQCIKDCINQSPDTNCALTDVGCICRASAGNFLPDLITCMHGNCDNDLDNNLLLTPLQLACTLAGSPIPASALRNAESLGSSLATQVTKTVTLGGADGASSTNANGNAGTTTTIEASSTLSTVTVATTNAEDSSTIYLGYPITIDGTTIVSGPPSTITSMSVNSAGSMPTVRTSLAPTSSSGSLDSVSSTTIRTTSVATHETSSPSTETSSSRRSSATTISDGDGSDSAPFKDTNAASRELVDSWLGVSVLVCVGCLLL